MMQSRCLKKYLKDLPNIPFKPQQSNFEAVTNKDNSSNCLTSSKSTNQTYTCRNSKTLCGQQSSLPSSSLQCITMQPPSARNSYSIYPLHFGDSFQPKNYTFDSKTVTTLKSHFSGNKTMGVGQNGIPTPMRNSHETKCDLSLRLGQLVNPSTSIDASWSQEVGISGSISFQRRRLLSSPLRQTGSDFCFFPGMIAKEQLDSSLFKKSQEISMNVENSVRLRKATTSHSSEDEKSDWRLKVPS
ncbi:hypothetical protein LIER_01148 [Lithospermum erythrorhizon]|uniref:Uncharacterized protein n=1 Tax=Lithospermum erythrorhizon TaxID=34254 RepID=A0AAV3NJX0_LITER